MSWDRKLFQTSPRMLQLVKSQRDRRPPEPRPTQEEAARIEPLVPLWASGQLPVDPLAKDKLNRWFQVKRGQFRKPGDKVDDGGNGNP